MAAVGAGGRRKHVQASPAENYEAELEAADLASEAENLSNGIKFVDCESILADLVNASSLRNHPIHRWYYYKEGFSPDLPVYLAEKLGVGSTKTVADTFAGVGTTALSLATHPLVRKLISLEYSPFASFVAATKLSAVELDPRRLTKHAARLAVADSELCDVDIPALAAFRNPKIFDRPVLHQLLRLRDRVNRDLELNETEKMFFLLGIAAIAEDVSGAMKDGRALRILHGRKRRQLGLVPSLGASDEENVQASVSNQWLAMAEDVEKLTQVRDRASVIQVRGDARTLGNLLDSQGNRLALPESVGAFFYSPPYLNCIDYTEVYKIELWLLGLIANHSEFRALREGTLRSHPSIEFPSRPATSRPQAHVFDLLDRVTNFLAHRAARPSIGKIHGAYFVDMYEVLREQFAALEPGGAIACVVANSTFSRRAKTAEGEMKELWRLPVLTDVFISRIAETAGFEQLEIWVARSLRPKNVNGGSARESIIVARKPVSAGN